MMSHAANHVIRYFLLFLLEKWCSLTRMLPQETPEAADQLQQCSKRYAALAEKSAVPLSGPHFGRRLLFGHVVVARCFLWCKHKRVRSKRLLFFFSLTAGGWQTPPPRACGGSLINSGCVCHAFRLTRPCGRSQGTSLQATKGVGGGPRCCTVRTRVRAWARVSGRARAAVALAPSGETFRCTSASEAGGRLPGGRRTMDIVWAKPGHFCFEGNKSRRLAEKWECELTVSYDKSCLLFPYVRLF